MTDFKSELRKIVVAIWWHGESYGTGMVTADTMSKEDLENKSINDIIALFISKGYMTGQEWYNKFTEEATVMATRTSELLKGSDYLEAAQRASGIKEDPSLPSINYEFNRKFKSKADFEGEIE